MSLYLVRGSVYIFFVQGPNFQIIFFYDDLISKLITVTNKNALKQVKVMPFFVQIKNMYSQICVHRPPLGPKNSGRR